MRIVLGLSLALVCGCASSGAGGGPSSSAKSAPSAPVSQTVRVDGAGSMNVASSGPSTSAKTLPYAMDRVWGALPAVYDSLGIPVTTYDGTQHVIANDGFKARFRLAKVSLSRYLDCGDTQMGPSADSYEVFLSVRTQLSPAEAGSTTAVTSLEASARPVQFSQPPSRCSSRNVLEPRVAELVGRALAKSP